MTEVLYRKYRPTKFSEVKGQDHVVQTLKGAIEMDKVAHAYLFSGPRGTGKTTMARIMAKTLNCTNLSKILDKKFSGKLSTHQSESAGGLHHIEPCNVCDTCNSINNNRSLDIIEIDGASNRGIEEIRNIKEMARVASSQNKYKIFIIDEVHSLTKDAFNALLKTLEEPPAHVKFILATTEPHKLLPTVLSRVQRFDFRKITNSLISEKIREIAASEKIKIDDEVIRLIAVNSDGSLRDAESNMARLISLGGNDITLKGVEDILGFIPFENYSKLFDVVIKKDHDASINLINEYYKAGLDLDNYITGLLGFLRKIIVSKASTNTSDLLSDELTIDQMQVVAEYAKNLETKYIINAIKIFSEARIEMKTTPIPQLPLELAVADLTKSA